jgi:hypothetical protein
MIIFVDFLEERAKEATHWASRALELLPGLAQVGNETGRICGNFFVESRNKIDFSANPTDTFHLGSKESGVE